MSTIHTIQAKDYSDYLRQVSQAKKKSAAAALQAAYEKSISALDRSGEGLEQDYRAAANDLAGESRRAGHNFAQYAAANGLNNGAAGQAELARGIALQQGLAKLGREKAEKAAQLEQQRVQAGADYEYQLALSDGQEEADLADKLYKEQIRRDELDYDIRKYWYENGITQGSSAGADTGTNTGTGTSTGYDNGGLDTWQIKQMQLALGVTQDGFYGPETLKAAGGLTAQQLWEKLNTGTAEEKMLSESAWNYYKKHGEELGFKPLLVAKYNTYHTYARAFLKQALER